MPAETYLDFAATAAVRPPHVAEAVLAYLSDSGATAGRGAHRRARAAARLALHTRQALAELFNIPGDPGRICFASGATHALNTALFGLLRPGDAVVRTQLDHNAVRRPVARLRLDGVEERVLFATPGGEIDLDEARAALSRGSAAARVLVLPHASNVLGSLLPVKRLAELAREAGALVLLDAAQTAGHLPVDVNELGADLLAASGHKGLLGPPGIGLLWVRPSVEIEPLIFGGTGSDSAAGLMPAAYPDRLEAGTQNGVGIAGLHAGIRYLLEAGIAAGHRREQRLKAMLHSGLGSLPGVVVHSPPAPEGVPIVTVTTPSLRADRLALALERDHGIVTRSGLHCAPEAHAVLGTMDTGAVRFSLGWSTSEDDVRRAIIAVAAVIEHARSPQLHESAA